VAWNLIANAFRVRRREVFEIPDTEREVPQVDFGGSS